MNSRKTNAAEGLKTKGDTMKAMDEYVAHLRSKGYEVLDAETVSKPGMLFKIELNDDGSPKGLKCVKYEQLSTN